MSDQSQPAESEQTYLSATSEIDTILAEIESASELDIDALAGRVERAAHLISFCNERLKSAETRVRKVAQDLTVSPVGGAVEETPSRGSEPVEPDPVQNDSAIDFDSDDDVPF